MPLSAPGKFKTDGSRNSYGGDSVGNNFTATAADNSLVGNSAAIALTSALRDTIIGSGAAPTITTASDITAVGFGALLSCDPVNTVDVVAIGKNAVSINVAQAPSGLVAIGNSCCAITTNQNVSQFVVIGHLALSGTSPSGVLLSGVVIGANAGVNSGDAPNSSVFVGESCGSNTAGSGGSLVYMGFRAGRGKSGNSYQSVAIGAYAANTGLTGGLIQSVLVGANAGSYPQGALTCTRSVGVGSSVLAGKFSSDDVIIGANAFGTGVSSTSDNVVVGAGAAQNAGNSVNNTLIGSGVAPSLTVGSNNTVVGKGIDVSVANAVSEVRIGAGGSTTPLINGSEAANERPILLDGVLRLRRTARGAPITSTDETIVGCTASNIAITIPTVAINRSGSIFIIKDESGTASGVSAITVQCQGAQTIDGSANKTIIVAYGVLRLYSNGSNLFTF